MPKVSCQCYTPEYNWLNEWMGAEILCDSWDRDNIVVCYIILEFLDHHHPSTTDHWTGQVIKKRVAILKLFNVRDIQISSVAYGLAGYSYSYEYKPVSRYLRDINAINREMSPNFWVSRRSYLWICLQMGVSVYLFVCLMKQGQLCLICINNNNNSTHSQLDLNGSGAVSRPSHIECKRSDHTEILGQWFRSPPQITITTDRWQRNP